MPNNTTNHQTAFGQLAALLQGATSDREFLRGLLAWLGDQTESVSCSAALHFANKDQWEAIDVYDHGSWSKPFTFPEAVIQTDCLVAPKIHCGQLDQGAIPFADARSFAAALTGAADDPSAIILLSNETEAPSDALDALQLAAGIWAQRCEQSAAEQLRLRRENSLCKALEQLQADYWEVDMITGALQTVGLRNTLGLNDGEFPSLNDWHARIHPDDLPRIRAAYEQCRGASWQDSHPGHGAAARFECEFRIRDANERWVWMRGIGAGTSAISPADPPLRLSGFDLRLRPESRIAADESRLVELVEIGLLEVAADGALLSVSSNLSQLLHHEQAPDEFPLLLASSSQTSWTDIWEHLGTQPVWEGELLLQSGEDSVVAADARFARIGEAPRAAGVIQSSRRRKQRQQAEWHQRELLSHASRLQTLGELVGAIAHEMTQPLGAISNYASACRTLLERFKGKDGGLEIPAKQAEQAFKWLGSVVDLAHTAGGTIDRLRKFSKRTAPHRSTFDLNPLIEEAIQLHLGDAYNQNIQLHIELEPGTPLCIVDEVQFHQVISHLLRNAFEATESNAGPRVVWLSSELLADSVRVSVKDNGKGLDAIDESIYEPFETTRSDRMGVGLSITRSIVEAHHGQLWHELNPEGGVTFSFTIPLSGSGSSGDLR